MDSNRLGMSASEKFIPSTCVYGFSEEARRLRGGRPPRRPEQSPPRWPCPTPPTRIGSPGCTSLLSASLLAALSYRNVMVSRPPTV